MNSNRTSLKFHVSGLVKTRDISIVPTWSNMSASFIFYRRPNTTTYALIYIQSLESIAHGNTLTHYLLSFVGKVFFSSVLVFLSFEVSNLDTSDKSGLSDIFTVNITHGMQSRVIEMYKS